MGREDREDAGGRGGLLFGIGGFAGVAAGPALAGAGPLGWLPAVAGGLLWWFRRGGAAGSWGAGVAALGFAWALAPVLSAMPGPARLTLAATVLMASWWITVAIPIAATSLVPLVLFPALGVLPAGEAAGNYANNNIFLFMGGFILALGIERWGLHRRIALHVVRVIGGNPRRMVLGFMVASSFLSMWISNTATTLMMLPIALAVIVSLEGKVSRSFAPALLLGVAHAASIGGLATPIGTPPNISFLRILRILYPEAPAFSFGQWMLAFLPLVVLFVPVAWFIITAIHRTGRERASAGRRVLREELRALGPMGRGERRILVVFAVTALLWMTRKDLDLGNLTLRGWGTLLERLVGEPFSAANLHDATVAIAMAVLTFAIRGDPDADGRPRPLMDWPTAKRLPWGILLLFGGGFALAQAFRDSGLSGWLGEAFAAEAGRLGPVPLVASASTLLSFLTEVTSNTATTEVMLPVLGDTALAMEANPLLLMVPATLSASCAFMLPIATPPNAIVFGSGKLTMKEMIRTGILLNLAGILLVTAFYFLYSAARLGIDPVSLPGWATR